MNIPSSTVVTTALGAVAYAAIVYALDRSLRGRARLRYRYAIAALTIGVLFLILRRYVQPYDRRIEMVKAGVAMSAMACVLLELRWARQNRPVSEGLKRFVGIVLATTAILCNFNGFKYTYPPYWHHSEQFHYYMGAKYFHELGYDGLYRCTATAQDQLGVVQWRNESTGQRFRLDMSSEVREPQRTIRNLGGDNLLMPVTEVLEHPERCTARFSPERWNAFKDDVTFFRIMSDKQYWESMQRDHGYNPPPAWTILGSFFSNLHPADPRYLQFLASLDIIYLAGTFALIWWAFGWRVSIVAAIFWGCQALAPLSWTAGAFLRQDWFFYLIASACFARKRYFKLAGAAIVYASLLRIFPGLVLIGWFIVAVSFLVRHRRLAKSHQQALLGGALMAAILIPLSLVVAGGDSYLQFYRHTLTIHDRTPLVNHMGLRVLVSHNLGGTAASGRMKYTVAERLTDPFAVWKRMRSERYERYKWVSLTIVFLSSVFLIYTVRRIRLLWVAGCLGQMFIILLSQLTSYYYSFLVLSTLLTRAKPILELPILGFAALSQFVFWAFYWNDDKFAALTLLSLLLCYVLILAFFPKGAWKHA